MTDGYVGNDAEIVAEVQKHPEARVFAFGIGTVVNRFLLSKMAEEGNGEVEFVTTSGEAQPAADRFYERVHSPVLTDISIDWNGLPVAEVYPAHVRDLFAAKPVIITGRFTGAAQGTVVIRGTRAGGLFERALRIDFPAAGESNAVLEKIWARRKVDDYMSQDWMGMQQGQSAHKAEIIKVGLEHSLATQYTSFVAVETRTVMQDGKPVRIEVPVELPENVSKLAVQGDAKVAYGLSLPPPSPGTSLSSMTVDVTADAPMIEATTAQVTSTFTLSGGSSGLSGSFGTPAKLAKADKKTKAFQTKLSAELLLAYHCSKARIGDACKNAASGDVKVSVTLSATSAAIVQKLTEAGLKIDSGSSGATVTGTIDVAKLDKLAAITEVVKVTKRE